MVLPHVRTALVVLATASVLLQPARANVPEYKLGDIAEADVVTPVALVVVNPEATETLREKVSQEIPYVVRHVSNVASEVEEQLRDAIMIARRAFVTNLQQADLDAASFERVIQASSVSAPREFPFELFAPLWARGQSEESAVNSLLQALHAVMGQPIVLNKTETPLPANEQVRLVSVKDLDRAPTLQELELPGQLIASGKVLSLWRARRLTENHFPPGSEAAGHFVASLLRVNAVPDPASTNLLRSRRRDGVAVNDSYEPAQIVIRKGQTIDRKALSALAVLREKSMIGTLQSRLEHAQSNFAREQAVATQIKSQTKWIVGGLAVICVALVVILLRLRTKPSTALVAVSTNSGWPGPAASVLSPGEDLWRRRALAAEDKAERAQEAIRSGVMGWMREKVMRTLFRQRAELLDAQKRAEREMLELEQRLERLQAPLQDRLAAYEQRIEELERELAVKGEENRELIGARITVTRQYLDMERERGRFSSN